MGRDAVLCLFYCVLGGVGCLFVGMRVSVCLAFVDLVWFGDKCGRLGGIEIYMVGGQRELGKGKRGTTESDGG
ncbi:hypothetical protein F5144DRAFT_561300 [Chaetomium tenue]|uniref:Uncharacterized protein n=1 Tax=Chaetomium tenue TaxID=1854479 RepID=A0ACB7PFG3_9PEZI|nr:hypothetical protein F5144DRAFT_561300 [Chaetomium globosum]